MSRANPEGIGVEPIELKPQPAGGDMRHQRVVTRSGQIRGAAANRRSQCSNNQHTEHARIMCVIWVLHLITGCRLLRIVVQMRQTMPSAQAPAA